jgi:monoterpene epsilon-lactone hydrolase
LISWQARLLNLLLRFSMKRHARCPLNLALLRTDTLDPPRAALRVPADMRIDAIHEDGLSFDLADRTTPREAPLRVLVLYLHGGGYLFGSPRTHRQPLLAMARAFRAPAYGLDYRLAPEHPFPAAYDDALQAYQWLLGKHPDAAIVLAGDSAGAGLAIATALGIRDAGLPPPLAIVGFSPYADLAVTGASVESNGRSCAMFKADAVREAAALYLAGADPRDQRASPLYGDLTGLPPMLLFVSRHELLRDDTLRLADRAVAAGVKVELVVRDKLPHVWPVFMPGLPEARDAFATVAAFARRVNAL